MPEISIIVPVLNEAHGIVACLTPLQAWRAAGHEIIVVDGGSIDDTVPLATPYADHVLVSAPGRARQMNLGAEQSRGRLLVFLHADTLLPAAALTTMGTLARGVAAWGRFDVRLAGEHWGLRVIEGAMNFRSRLTGIATGDQALFVSRELFDRVRGYRSLDLMEDIDLSARLKKIARPWCLSMRVTTSSRRWEQSGLAHTILRMWWLRLQFFCGVDSTLLARRYRAVRELR